jgi:predicted  nucleic acid-binding Zn-ribbon protein
MSSSGKWVSSEGLRLLVKLQDLDLMIKEARDSHRLEEETMLGFKIDSVSRLEEARQNMAKSIDPQLLEMYERLQRRYERAVAPVYRGACLGCFATLPTALGQAIKSHEEVKVCENCGRILYWLGE